MSRRFKVTQAWKLELSSKMTVEESLLFSRQVAPRLPRLAACLPASRDDAILCTFFFTNPSMLSRLAWSLVINAKDKKRKEEEIDVVPPLFAEFGNLEQIVCQLEMYSAVRPGPAQPDPSSARPAPVLRDVI